MTTDRSDVASAIQDAIEDDATATGIVDMLDGMADDYEDRIRELESEKEELESRIEYLEDVPHGLDEACTAILLGAGVCNPSVGDVIVLTEAVQKVLMDKFNVSIENCN